MTYPSRFIHCRSNRPSLRPVSAALLLVTLSIMMPLTAAAQVPDTAQQAQPAAVHHGGGEASLVLPDLSQVSFGGINARTLLFVGLGVCLLGLLFGLVIYIELKKLPVHRSMREISDLIYETCKTYLYLIQQGKLLLILELFIGIIIAVYFGFL